MEESCAYCYKMLEKPLRCGQCHKRAYCSRPCQVADWKMCHHKHFCKVGVGEPGIDWEVKSSPKTKAGGVGVFALRSFQKNDIIMLERPIVVLRSEPNPRISETDISETARPAVDRLHPPNGTLADKFQVNGMSTTDDDDNAQNTGLFIRMSRVNHDCIGNSTHRFLENRKVKILVASCGIEKGEEITFSYTHPLSSGKKHQKTFKLLHVYGFRCHCKVCTNPDLEAELERMQELDSGILETGSNGKVEKAIRMGKALIQLYDKHGLSSWLYQRTYYDMYQVAITKGKTWAEGKYCIKKAHEAALSFTSDPHNAAVVSMRAYADNPASHRNYMLLN